MIVLWSCLGMGIVSAGIYGWIFWACSLSRKLAHMVGHRAGMGKFS